MVNRNLHVHAKIPCSPKNITLPEKDKTSKKTRVEVDYKSDCHNDILKKDFGVKKITPPMNLNHAKNKRRLELHQFRLPLHEMSSALNYKIQGALKT